MRGSGCNRRAAASAKASVRASVVVVELVGAGTPNATTSEMGIGAGSKMQLQEGRLANRGQFEVFECDEIAINCNSDGMYSSIEINSDVRPE